MDDLLREFLSEANESIEALDRALVRFEREPEDPALLSEIFRVLHTIKGTCGFLGLPRLAAVAHGGENILGRFREGDLRPAQESVSAVLEAVDVIKALLAHLEAAGCEPAGDDAPLLARLDAIADARPARQEAAGPAPARQEITLSTVDCAVETALARVKQAPEGRRFSAVQEDELHGIVRDAVWAAISGEAEATLAEALAPLALDRPEEVAALATHLRDCLAELGVDAADARDAAETAHGRAAPSVPPASAPAAGEPPPSAVAAQTIRVHVDALEQLMNVASELVLIRNQLLQTLRAQPESPFAGPLQRLNHVTTELQESVVTTRMQPIGAAWAKLPRLARDLAIELGKRIDIEMRGEETELDRQVLDLIRDPLTHMIRNAADHGLETPGERARAGKPEAGRILLSARHEGNHIVIEVADDGRGLACSKLRAKGLAQGLLTPHEAETYSDAKIHQLIFHPGFSTAAKVSGISGRGVGMDVVRTNIEKIGGTVELASVEGQGARFIIRIPLTLTIVSALIVDCCGERFAMPQSSVVELVGVGGGASRAIEQVNGAPVLRLRDRLLPLVSLQDLMRLAPAREDNERSILVTRVGSFSYGIVVDRVFDTEEIVVKPTASILRDIPYYSGATILGDGAVIMILDPRGIAARIGAVDGDDAGDMGRNEARAETRTQLLVVRGAGRALKAAPLQLVSRIEEIASEAVEHAGGRPVLQYRGRLMPLIGIDDSIDVARPGAARPVLVFDDGDRAIGLMVEEVVDIVEAPLRQEFRAHGAGGLGSVVAAERVTDILDLAHYWRLAALDAAPANPARRRALLIDPNPFQRNLVAPMLAIAGYEVSMADEAAAAAALIERAGAFDVILSDAASVREEDIPHAAGPVVALYDEAPAGAGRTASRFDRDGLLRALADIAERSAA